MDYEIAFWVVLLVVAMLFISIGKTIYGPSQTVSDETMRRLCK